MSQAMLPILRQSIAALCLAATAGTAAAATPATGGQAQVNVAGKVRTYAVHVPRHAVPAGGFPLVLAFHGGGMQGKAMRRLTQLDRTADARGFIVVYPDGVDTHWNDGRSTIRNPQDDVAFVAALIERLRQSHPIDPARIYATGISNGALFAERLGCDMADRIAAIAPVAGTMPAELEAGCRPVRPVAALHINGTADPIMPFDGGAVADFGGRGEGGQVLSAARTADFWARANGCRDAAVTQALPVAAPFDRTRVRRKDYAGCPAAGVVTQLTVVGGGHTWPGGPQYARPLIVGLASRQVDASALIADFFLSRPTSR